MKTENPVNDLQKLCEEIEQNTAKYRIYSVDEAFRHMTRRRTEKEQLLYAVTDDVLFNVWDALYLSLDQEYREEYVPFLPHVFDLLLSTRDGLEMYDYLVFIEETRFAAPKGDELVRRRASRTVDLLLEYRGAIFKNETAKFAYALDGDIEPGSYPA